MKKKKIEKINKKTVKMFAVTYLEDLHKQHNLQENVHHENIRLLCIVPTFAEAVNFLSRFIIKTDMSEEHYVQWCENHGVDSKLDSSRHLYIERVIGVEESRKKYGIIDVNYTYKDIALILRMTSGYEPIGCAFEDPIEYDMIKQREAFAQFEKELQKLENEFESVLPEADKMVSLSTKKGSPKKKKKTIDNK